MEADTASHALSVRYVDRMAVHRDSFYIWKLYAKYRNLELSRRTPDILWKTFPRKIVLTVFERPFTLRPGRYELRDLEHR